MHWRGTKPMALFGKREKVFPMPRSAFVLLMLSVVLSVLPHLQRVPQWMLLVFGAILLWRVQVFRQRTSFPKRWLRFSLVSFAFVGVVFHHGTIFGPDAGVGLLITAYLFKQLEMYTKRDAFLIVILSYFVLATAFLFSKSLFVSLYIMLVLVVITAALIALNQTDSKVAIWSPLKTAIKFLGQAVPLLLVLFFLFPRIGPIWNLNLNTQSATIGLNDRISPGDIANLSRSEKLAFRVEFDGPMPSQAERYWRAVVFDRFDGRTWYAVDSNQQRLIQQQNIEVVSDRTYQYQVYLQPTGQNWLMAMPWAKVSGVTHAVSNSNMLYAKDKIDAPLRYSVVSYPDFKFHPGSLSTSEFRRYTQLPNNTNPLAYEFARKLFKKSGYDPDRFSNAILRVFNQEEFVYTLKPPTLSGNTIDEFLFSTRRGFCSHYAGAYVFLLRSLGIPARMVGGYQGGVPHPIGSYLLVHQYDAHAWAEYWVQGQGWQRVDPTAAVAPHRIEVGPLHSNSDLSFLEDSPLSPDKLRNIPLFSRLRMMADYVDYLWFKNVVSFDKNSQNKLFERLLGQVTPQRIAILIGSVGGAVLLGMFIVIALSFRGGHRLDQTDKIYAKFLRKLEKQGLKMELGEGPSQFANRAAERFQHCSETIRNINSIYVSLKYAHSAVANGPDIEQQRKQLEKEIQILKLK